MKIDITYDVRTDTPPSKDPDSRSQILKNYHKQLWSKTLPSGEEFQLVSSTPKTYLHHKSELGEFFLSSDAITHSYSQMKRMSHIIEQVPSEDVESLFSTGCTDRCIHYLSFQKS